MAETLQNILTMRSKVLSYTGFSALFEGGAAIKQSRRIMESEVPATLESIEKLLIPLLGNGEMGQDYITIGSIGKKPNPTDTSGDIDLGVDSNFIARKFRISAEQFLEFIYNRLSEGLPQVLGFDPEMKLMKGINVLSIGWPVEGSEDKGIVQLDIIPLSDMDWAKFIFYSPDYKIGESKYKSAHRNWLFQAILSSMKDIESTDQDGQPENYFSYDLRLSDGIYLSKKTFKGVTKRLKNPKTIPGSSQLITNDPDEFLNMLFGPGVKERDVRTFESTWNLVTSPNFIHRDKLNGIKEDLVRYLKNGDFEIPSEIK